MIIIPKKAGMPEHEFNPPKKDYQETIRRSRNCLGHVEHARGPQKLEQSKDYHEKF